jgi:hypothetical protein
VRLFGFGNRVVNNYIATPWVYGVKVGDGELEPAEGTVSGLTATVLTDTAAQWSAGQFDGHSLWVLHADGGRKQYPIVSTSANSLTVEPASDMVGDGGQVGDGYKVVSGYMPCIGCLVANNTVWGSTREAFRIGDNVHPVMPHQVVMVNNIAESDAVTGSSLFEQYGTVDGATYTTNLAFATGTMDPWWSETGQPQPAGIVSADPQLSHDGTIHRLQAASTAAVDQGTVDPNVADDIDGDPRDATPDIGADELGGQLVEVVVGHTWRAGGPETILIRAGSGGAAGSGGQGAGGTGGTGASSSGGAAGAGATASGGPAQPTEDSGCGCRLAGRPLRWPWAAAGVLAWLAAAARRRRPRARGRLSAPGR